MNYAWYVGNIRPIYAHWQGGPTSKSIPEHSTRVLINDPLTFEFDNDWNVTYAPWYNPSYWHKGYSGDYRVDTQIDVIKNNYRALLDNYLENNYLIMCLISMLFVFSLIYSTYFKYDLFNKLLLWLGYTWMPTIFATVLILMVIFTERYLAGFFFVSLLTVMVFANSIANRLKSKKKFIRIVFLTIHTILFVNFISIQFEFINKFGRQTLKDAIRKNSNEIPHDHFQTALDLQSLGLKPRDKIAVIGYSFGAYWAHLGQWQIVAEIPLGSPGIESFCNKHRGSTKKLVALLKSHEIKAIIIDGWSGITCASQLGWKNIHSNKYYAKLINI